ncbi:MAG: alpha/beta hydrolase [Thermoguttaceae bacterium]
MSKRSRRRLGFGSPIAHASLVALAAWLGVTAARAAEQPIWILDTRCVNGCGEPNEVVEQIQHERLDADCCRRATDAQDFRAAQEVTTPMVVFVHGNNTDADQALTKGLYVYNTIRLQAGDKPFRFVIWSWPADRFFGILNRGSTRAKAEECDTESYYLAAWLNRLAPGTRICLAGHSFGPRIITGALHLLAGGPLACRAMPEATVAAWKGGKRNPVRTVLMAAALDADWLAPDGRHGLAPSIADRMLITCNDRDRILRYYPRLWHRQSSEALGLVGPCGVDCLEHVETIDVSGEVGRFHDWRDYAFTPEVRCRWTEYAFLDEPSEEAAKEKASGGSRDGDAP